MNVLAIIISLLYCS